MDVQIDKMHGEDVENFDRSSRMGMGAGYAPSDTVPFMVEPDLGYDKKSGTHHAYSNLNAGKKTGPIVDDPAKAYEEHKRAHFHMRFVAAVIDKQQVQAAQQRFKTIFDKPTLKSLKEHKELTRKAQEEAKARLAKIEQAEREAAAQAKQDAQKAEQPAPEQEPSSAQAEPEQERPFAQLQPEKENPEEPVTSKPQPEAKAGDDCLLVYDDDTGVVEHQEPMTTKKPQPAKVKQAQAKQSVYAPAQAQVPDLLEAVLPHEYVHTTESKKPVEVTVYENKEAADAPAGVFELVEQALDPYGNKHELLLKNNRFTVAISGDNAAFHDLINDRQARLNAFVRQSGKFDRVEISHDGPSWLLSAASIVLDLTPIVGNLKLGAEAIYGYDLVTGEELSPLGRAIRAVGVFVPLASKMAKAATEVKVVGELAGEIGKLGKVGEALNDLGKAEKVAEAVGEIGKGAGVASEILIDLGKMSKIEAIAELDKIAPDAIAHANLAKIGENLWRSPSGLIWGACKKFGTRINHVLAHTFKNSVKDSHGVFSVPSEQIIKLVDEAWLKHGVPVPGDPYAYIIELGRKIGTKGETAIRIAANKETLEILSAYPVL